MKFVFRKEHSSGQKSKYRNLRYQKKATSLCMKSLFQLIRERPIKQEVKNAFDEEQINDLNYILLKI